jgi:hypothetical protein
VLVKEDAQVVKRYVKVLEMPNSRTTKLCAGCWREAWKCGERLQSIRCRSIECFERGRRCKEERDVNATQEKGIRHVCATSNTEIFRMLSKGAPMRSTTLSEACDVAFVRLSCPDVTALFGTGQPSRGVR